MINLKTLLFLVFSGVLLHKSSSQDAGGAVQTDEHILGVVDLLVEEKKLRLQLEQSVTQMKQEHDQLQQDFSTRTSTLEANVAALQNSLRRAEQTNRDQATIIQQLSRNLNKTEANIKSMMAQLNKVYVTACTSSTNSLSSGQVVVFPSKKSNNGLNHVSSLTSSGTFTAEEPGLYLVTATIRSQTSGSHFYIYKNSSIVLRAYIGTWYSSTYYESGTGVALVELNTGDNINIKTGVSMYVHGTESCLSIVKLK